jgi:hypothetical protein
MISTLKSSFFRLSLNQRLLLLLLAAVPSILALVWLAAFGPKGAECVPVAAEHHNHNASLDEASGLRGAAPSLRPLTLLDRLESEKADLLLQLSRLSDVHQRDVALCESRSTDTATRLNELQSLALTQRDKWRQDTSHVIASLEESLANCTRSSAQSFNRVLQARLAAPLGAVIDAQWSDAVAAQWRGTVPRIAAGQPLSVAALESASGMRELLQNRWIFLYGDSTMRVLFNTLLDAVEAPASARLLYGDVCSEFMNATDSRDMCRCRLQRSHKDWYDADAGLRISFAWKESMLDEDNDARRLARGEWVVPRVVRDRRKQPDVLVVNSGFHAFHMQSPDESVVFRGDGLSLGMSLRVAGEADAFFDLLRSGFLAHGGCAFWRATNTVGRSQRLAAAPFASLSNFVGSVAQRRGVHLFNATASLSANPPPTHASDDGLHFEKVAPIWATLLAHAIRELCPTTTD